MCTVHPRKQLNTKTCCVSRQHALLLLALELVFIYNELSLTCKMVGQNWIAFVMAAAKIPARGCSSAYRAPKIKPLK